MYRQKRLDNCHVQDMTNVIIFILPPVKTAKQQICVGMIAELSVDRLDVRLC